MIYVDIEVPVLGKCYDFKLEPEEKVGLLLEEILYAICQKEQCMLNEKSEQFVLTFPQEKVMLHPQHTLEEYKVETGCRLLLV